MRCTSCLLASKHVLPSIPLADPLPPAEKHRLETSVNRIEPDADLLTIGLFSHEKRSGQIGSAVGPEPSVSSVP